MAATAVEQDLDRQIVATHKRFAKAMNARLGDMSPETKERYFALLAKLTAKLEEGGKSLREVMHEMTADAMSVILQEIQSA